MSVMTDDSTPELNYGNIITLFRETEDPVLTAPEVADKFNVSTQAANYRLKKLVEREKLERKQVGGAAVVYWIKRI